MRSSEGGGLVFAEHLLCRTRRLAFYTVPELVPVDGRCREVGELHSRNGRVLILNGELGLSPPVIGRTNPEAVGKEGIFARGRVREPPPRGCEKRIYIGFIELRFRRIALALHGPVVARMGLGHKVDARIAPTEICARRKLFPEPYRIEEVRIGGCGL